jgi:hypothetical protein
MTIFNTRVAASGSERPTRGLFRIMPIAWPFHVVFVRGGQQFQVDNLKLLPLSYKNLKLGQGKPHAVGTSDFSGSKGVVISLVNGLVAMVHRVDEPRA